MNVRGYVVNLCVQYCMKRLLRLIVFVTAMAFVLAACRHLPKSSGNPSGRIDVYEGIAVVELSGSWQEMGAQYGRLAKPYLEDVLEFLGRKLAVSDETYEGDRSSGYSATPAAEAARQTEAERACDIAEKLFSHYPDHLKDFFEAAAESSGISLDRLKLCNAVEYIEGCFCSAMAVNGEYSSDGGLVFGRNYDAASYADIDKDVLVTVYHPDDGLAAATIGYAGEIYCVNGLNEKGIFIELNNGMPSAGSDIHWEMRPATSELFELLFKAEDIDDVNNFFETTSSFSSFIIGVSDGHEARLYEWCYDGVKRSDGQTPDGLTVGTNHYVNPEWEFPVPSDAESWDSQTRRANILTLAEEYKGKIDVERMKVIMSTPMEEGGPRHPWTRYQMVVEPAGLNMHLKLSCNDSWTELPMYQYLVSRQ